MLLVTVLLVAASCSVVNARTPKRSAFDATPRGDEYITQSSLFASAGESQRISRKYRPAPGSTQSSNHFYLPSDDQHYNDQFTRPLRAQRRSRKYVTSDKIRSKSGRLRKASKDYSNEYFTVTKKQKNSNEYVPGSSDQDITNEYDQAYQTIDDWKQENPNKADDSTKLSQQEDFKQFESQYSIKKENDFHQSADYNLNYDHVKNEQLKKNKATSKIYKYDDYRQFDGQQQNSNDHLIDTYLNYDPIKNQPTITKDSYKFSQPEYYGKFENSYSTPKTSDYLTNSYENYNPYHDQLNNQKASTSLSPPENLYSVLKQNEFDQSAGSRGNFNPVLEQSSLKIGNVTTKFSRPNDFSQFAGHSVQITSDKSLDSYGNKKPVKNTVYSHNTFLPSTEFQPASPQYLPPAEIKYYYLPSPVDIPTKEYVPSEVNKPYEQYLPSKVNNPVEEFQPIEAVTPSKQSTPPTVNKEAGVKSHTLPSYSDALYSKSYVTSEKPQQKFEYLPPSESQLLHQLVPSSYDQFNLNLTTNLNDKETVEHYNPFKESEASIYSEPGVITTSNRFTTEDEKLIPPTYLPQIEQPVFQEYAPSQNYNNQPELMSNGTADRRNDISSTIHGKPTHSFMFPQKKPTIALRPIKQFNFGNSPFQQMVYPIDRSSLDQNPSKIEALNSNFVSPSSFLDTTNIANNHFSQSGQSMPFGSKLPYQSFNSNNIYASSRSSNIPPSINQLDLPYETSTHGINSNSNSVAPNAGNNLRQPIELILPSQSQNLQHQASSYASNFAHHSYSQESTTEDVPILKQTSEIAYDGSFHYETLTGDQTHVIQEGHIENPGTDNEEQVIHGSYSFLGSDGITYTINYVADANGFRAIGDHLPTPPPIPEVIQRSIDMNIAAEANKAAENFHFGQSSLSLADELNRAGQENSYDLIRRNYNVGSRNYFKNYQNSLARNANNYKNSSKVHKNQNYQNFKTDKISNQDFSHDTKSVSQSKHIGQSNGKSGIIKIQKNLSPKLDTPTNQPFSSKYFPPSNIRHSDQNSHLISNYDIQSSQNSKSVSNGNYPSSQTPRSINNNHVQHFNNPQFIKNNDVQSFQTSQSVSIIDDQSYQTPQSTGFDDVQSYQTPQSVIFDNVQSFQTPKSISNSNYQAYQTPQSIIFNNDQSYEPPESVNNLQNDQNNFQDYLSPQFLKSENTPQDRQMSQAVNNDNLQSYETAQTDNDMNIQIDQYSNYGSKTNTQENQSPPTSNENNIMKNPQIERKSDYESYLNNQDSFNNYPEYYQTPGNNQNYDKSNSNSEPLSSKDQVFQTISTNFNNINQHNLPVPIDKSDSFQYNGVIDDSHPYPETFKIILPADHIDSSSENNVHRSIALTKGK